MRSRKREVELTERVLHCLSSRRQWNHTNSAPHFFQNQCITERAYKCNSYLTWQSAFSRTHPHLLWCCTSRHSATEKTTQYNYMYYEFLPSTFTLLLFKHFELGAPGVLEICAETVQRIHRRLGVPEYLSCVLCGYDAGAFRVNPT